MTSSPTSGSVRNQARDLWRVPSVALTESDWVKDWQLCLDAGMNDFINKPFCSQRLFEARRSLSKSSNLRDELDFQSADKLWSEIEGLSIRMSMSRIPRQHLDTVANAREHVQASPPIKTATGEGNRQIAALSVLHPEPHSARRPAIAMHEEGFDIFSVNGTGRAHGPRPTESTPCTPLRKFTPPSTHKLHTLTPSCALSHRSNLHPPISS